MSAVIFKTQNDEFKFYQKGGTVYSVREEVHRCLEERDMNALKVTN